MDERQAVSMLGALAQTVRLRVFRALIGAGPSGLTPGALSAVLDVSASTLSFHLKELMHSGLVTQQRDGRQLIYRPAIDAMSGLLGYLTDHCCQASCDDASQPCTDLSTHPHLDLDRRPTMSDQTYNVLFICTHNSARSIMAEGILNGLGRGRFKAWSAGSQPSGHVHPLALKTLATLGQPVENYRSKDWQDFARADAPHFDFVFTVCDNAAGEVCPVWPGQPMTAHWGVADPSAVEGSPAQQDKLFWDTALILKRRIELMLALPLASLDRLTLQREITAIGTRV